MLHAGRRLGFLTYGRFEPLGGFMAKDGNTFAKRQRETLKRQKAEDKRRRRQQRKDQPSGYNAAPMELTTDEANEAAMPSELP